MAICCKCKRKGKKFKRWIDYNNKKEKWVCPKCWHEAKKIRHRGFQIRAGLKQGKMIKVKDLKKKNREEHYKRMRIK